MFVHWARLAPLLQNRFGGQCEVVRMVMWMHATPAMVYLLCAPFAVRVSLCVRMVVWLHATPAMVYLLCGPTLWVAMLSQFKRM